jgi:two-component system NtrC family response regulator
MSEMRLLVIDDEQAQRETLAGFLRKRGYRVDIAADGAGGLERLKREPVDLVITDMRMPGLSGLELLRTLRKESPHIAVIITTAFGSVEGAVEAMKEGAFTYLSKPIDLDELEIVIERALERQTLVRENELLRQRLGGREAMAEIVSGSGEMEEVLNLVARVAPSRATVLLRGESGTGKERLARAIHAASPRAQGPFIPVNMAALPESLVESELFGYEKGAFTGADRQRRGLFEQADGGTLFIDEVGDIPLPVQVKLLRVLQEARITRLGAGENVAVDVRVVAATHQDLEAMIRAQRFREDLYYRFNVVAIRIPPLRERRSDIPPLLEHFIQRFAEINGKAVTGVDAAALDLIVKYSYPGNVRELENAVERAVVLARGSRITRADLPLSIRAGASPLAATGIGEDGEGGAGGLADQVEALERRLVGEALERSGGNQSEAARLLGISEKNIRDRLKRWGWK